MALHTSTVLARTPAAISSYLTRVATTFGGDHPFLFSLSANAPELQTLVSRLTTFSSQTTGCLSAPLPGPASDGLISCSIGLFDVKKATPFRSIIPGRAAPQVGRWHAFRQRDDPAQEFPPGMEEGLAEGVNWADVWDRSAGNNLLPLELQALIPSDVNTVVYLSDSAPEGLANSLAIFPHATKLGLFASSTPFITGRPITLFQNGNVYSSGAVGIALTGEGRPESSIEFPGLRAITPILTVTSTEGNLVNTIDDGNPSRLLLAAIKKHGIKVKGSFKDDNFYLGAFQGDVLSQVYRITSGDPSRGTISLESHAAPTEGTSIQLYHLPKILVSADINAKYTQSEPTGNSLAFLASSSDMPSEVVCPEDATDEIATRLPNTFLASSENGFSLSRSHEGAWRCTVDGGLASLNWSNTSDIKS